MGLYVRRVNVYMVTLFTKVIKLTIVLMPPTADRFEARRARCTLGANKQSVRRLRRRIKYPVYRLQSTVYARRNRVYGRRSDTRTPGDPLWKPSPIGGAGDREVYSAVFSRVLEAVIDHSTER